MAATNACVQVDLRKYLDFVQTIGEDKAFVYLVQNREHCVEICDAFLNLNRVDDEECVLLMQTDGERYTIAVSVDLGDFQRWTSRHYFNNESSVGYAVVRANESSARLAYDRLINATLDRCDYTIEEPTVQTCAGSFSCKDVYVTNVNYSYAGCLYGVGNYAEIPLDGTYIAFYLIERDGQIDFGFQNFGDYIELLSARKSAAIDRNTIGFVGYKCSDLDDRAALEALSWFYQNMEVAKSASVAPPQSDRVYETKVEGLWTEVPISDLDRLDADRIYMDGNNHSTAKYQVVPRDPQQMFPVRGMKWSLEEHIKRLLISQPAPDLYLRRSNDAKNPEGIRVLWRGYLLGWVPKSLCNKIAIEEGESLPVKYMIWSRPNYDLSIAL